MQQLGSKSSPANKLTIQRPGLPVFPKAQSAWFLISTLNSFQGVLENSGCSGSWLSPYRGRWKVAIFKGVPRPCAPARGRSRLDLPAETREGVGAPPSRPRRRRRQHHGPRRRCRCPWPACSPHALFLLQTFGFCGRQETGVTVSKSSRCRLGEMEWGGIDE